MKRAFTSFCLSIMAAAAFAPVALADTTSTTDRISRVVEVGDLDLHSQAGARTAAHRIHVAADYVCGGDNLLWRRASDFQDCRNGAIDRALASLKAPMVSAALGRPTPTGMASR
jgi:UrcA family protein